MFDRFAEIDKKKEELERKKNARPDAMNHIDEWEGYVKKEETELFLQNLRTPYFISLQK